MVWLIIGFHDITLLRKTYNVSVRVSAGINVVVYHKSHVILLKPTTADVDNPVSQWELEANVVCFKRGKVACDTSYDVSLGLPWFVKKNHNQTSYWTSAELEEALYRKGELFCQIPHSPKRQCSAYSRSIEVKLYNNLCNCDVVKNGNTVWYWILFRAIVVRVYCPFYWLHIYFILSAILKYALQNRCNLYDKSPYT